MHTPVQRLPLDARTDRPLAPSLERQRLQLSLILMVLDLLAIFASFLAAGALYIGEFPSETALVEAVLLSPLFLVFGVYGGLYKPDLIYNVRRAALTCAFILALSAGFLIFITFYAKTTTTFSRAVFTLGCSGMFCMAVAIRTAVKSIVTRTVGPSLQNTAIIDAGGPAIHMDHAFRIDAREHGISSNIQDPANLDRVGRYMHNMDRVIVSCPQEERDRWAPLLRAAGVQGEFVSDALRRLGGMRIQTEPGFSTVVVSARPLPIEARITKRAMDLILSSAGVLLLSPVMLVTAILIKAEDGGPVLFRQRRMGRGNRFFEVYKFRSMRTEASDADAKKLTTRDDDRTTKVGRFIRRTSIDELPQLFNIWRGDMSLVGPRPHALGALAGAKLYWEVDGRYWNRHVLKPGLTGLAQVRGFRGNTEEEYQLADRLQADLEYIANWSLWLDIQILLKTAMVLVHDNAY